MCTPRMKGRPGPRRQEAVKPMAAGISNEEYFEILSRELPKALSEQTREGYVFRVDLACVRKGRSDDWPDRWKTIGNTISPGDGLGATCPIKGLAGSQLSEVGKAFLRRSGRLFWVRAPANPVLAGAMAVVEDVRTVKELIDAKMADRGHEHRNVKLGTGGIREIEFLAQTIQVLAGKQHPPALLHRSTLDSLKAFTAKTASVDEGARRAVLPPICFFETSSTNCRWSMICRRTPCRMRLKNLRTARFGWDTTREIEREV